MISWVAWVVAEVLEECVEADYFKGDNIVDLYVLYFSKNESTPYTFWSHLVCQFTEIVKLHYHEDYYIWGVGGWRDRDWKTLLTIVWDFREVIEGVFIE